MFEFATNLIAVIKAARESPPKTTFLGWQPRRVFRANILSQPIRLRRILRQLNDSQSGA